MENQELIKTAAAAAKAKKAEDPLALDLRGLSSIADYFFICGGTNPRKVKAIAEEIDATLDRAGLKPLRVEGLTESRWVVMDYGGVLVHVFLQEAREYYSLETLWGDAPRLGNREWGMGNSNRMYAEIKEEIVLLLAAALKDAAERGLLPLISLPPLEFQVPREKGRGDLATNAAMLLASQAGRPPAQIAGVIASLIGESVSPQGPISRVEADPRRGFLNFFISPAAIQAGLARLLSTPGSFGRTSAGGGRTVLLEFISANPTGPLTVAHGRQAAVGDVLANLLGAAGFEVCREYYLNDRGRQMEILGRSVLLRRRELAGEEIDFPEDHYRGGYIVNLARRIPDPAGGWTGMREEEAIGYCSDRAAAALLEMIRGELDDFGVVIDSWVSEKEVVASGGVEEALSELAARGCSYAKDGALWFKSSEFGDEKDRVLRKSTGELTYLSSDIAYHRSKYGRGFSALLDFWGPDHHGYIARLKGAMAALGLDPGILEVVIIQLSTLYEGKKKLSMSTRQGEFISLRQVLEKVGKDAARYFFVRRRKESHLDFDLELARKKSNDNPVYYVQYAHARINSIFRKFREITGEEPPDLGSADLSVLSGDGELELIRKLMLFPEQVESAALSRQCQLIPAYLEELAALFHGYYTGSRVISDDRNLTVARLALCRGVQVILAEGLGLLGVAAPESM
jgi:arginyl-tRNA synthetase